MTQKIRTLKPLKTMVRALFLFRLVTAYLEPGSSSFLLKILISGLVGFVVFFRQIWGYARAVWGRLAGRQPEPVELETAVPDQPPQNEIQ